MKETVLFSGNEAIARGAYEAGVRVAAAYPGTPSTEILESIVQYDRIYAEWSPNEKVALEVAHGAALGGARSLAAMKHVGVNVASDVLLTASYTGVNAGLVLISADDPGMHSSQNEQDNRHYARFAKIPMLEPSDSQEAKDFTIRALDLSEEFDTPVMLRTTTRVNHGKSVVRLSEPQELVFGRFEHNPQKYVMIPAHAIKRHAVVEERMVRLRELSDSIDLNRIEWGSREIGVITSGISYQYVKEVVPEASVLKLGMTYPIPEKLIRELAAKVKTLYVVEELDPFLEEQVRALGIEAIGKERFPITGELNPEIVAQGFQVAGCRLQGSTFKVQGSRFNVQRSRQATGSVSGMPAPGILPRPEEAQGDRDRRHRMLYAGSPSAAGVARHVRVHGRGDRKRARREAGSAAG